LAPYKLQTLSTLLAAASLGTLLVVPTFQLGKFLWESRRTANVSKLRLSITLAVLAALLGFVFFVPVPVWWSVKASFILQPERPAYVWAELPGNLVKQHVKDGDEVKKGDLLAELDNPQKRDELIGLRRQAEQHRLLAEAYAKDRRETRGADVDREQKLFEDRTIQADALEKELNGLALRAPRDGVVIKPPEPEDLGMSFELGSGRPFCRIGDPRKLEALLLIEQSDKDLVRGDEPVQLRLYSHALRSFPGTLRLANIEAQDIPPELSNTAGGQLQTKLDEATGVQKPVHTHYYGIVAIDNSDGILKSGMRGRAKIDAAKLPLGVRFWRWLKHTFSFET
jgi:putative peptide zinc metalloprotease protein